jgi:hypothetical protein
LTGQKSLKVTLSQQRLFSHHHLNKEHAPFDCNNNSLTSHVVNPMSAFSVTPVTSPANPVSVLPGTSYINVTPILCQQKIIMSLLTVATTSYATPESALPGTSFVNVLLM